MTREEEILAANAEYKPNRPTEFTVTPEGSKYGIIDINGTVGHVQQDKRTPAQQNALHQLYQSVVPEQVDINNPIAVRDYNTRVYNQLHKEGKVDDFYRSKGLITQNAVATKTAATPKTAADIVNEATTSGKSYLQMYQESMPKPEYEQERADRIQTHGKASIIADILKLVGEGITTKKGGQPIVRQSAVPMLNAELQKLNDTYKAEAKAYKQGGFNALLMDEQEKKREQAIEGARKAAYLQTLLTQAAKAELEAERQKATSIEKQKDRDFTAAQNAKKNSVTLTTAQMRAATGGGKSTATGGGKSTATGGGKSAVTDKGEILINGNAVKPPTAYVNDVVGKAKANAKTGDPIIGMSATEVFSAKWNDYYDYKDGKFVPKSKSSNESSSKKKIVGF